MIIESTACAITAQALCELSKNNTNVIFCDEKHMPYGQLSLLYGHHLSSGQVKRQSQWTQSRKASAWKTIVSQKIEWQKNVLIKHGKNEASELLNDYLFSIEDGDSTNREGHAAKVYFNALFGQGFGRRDENEINSALNYGYAIILSSVAREIVAAGKVSLSLYDFCKQISNELGYSATISEDIDIVGLFKLYDLALKESFNSLLEKLIEYINVNIEFLKTRVFIFVFLSKFLNSEQLKQFFEHCRYQDVSILTIEDVQLEPSNNQNIPIQTLIIDSDECEIPLNLEINT